MDRRLRTFALATLPWLLLLSGCGGDEGATILPAIDPPDVDLTEEYYLAADVTILPPGADQTVLAEGCDGVALAPGSVLRFQATELLAGLEFSSCVNPQLQIGGTDGSSLMGLSLTTTTVRPDGLADPAVPTDISPQFTLAGVNLDITCTRRNLDDGTLITLYASEPLDRPGVDPGQGDDPAVKEVYGAGDSMTLESYEVFEPAPGRTCFVPGSILEGTFLFVGQARILTGGTTQLARVEVRGCFRIPATSTTPKPLPASPGSC